MKSPSLAAHVLAFGVQATWAGLAALLAQVVLLGWYLASARRCAQRGRPWPAVRTVFFTLGLLVAAYTLEGGIAHYSRSNFTINVVRCLLLVNVVPPLLCFGTPLTLALRASSRQRSEWLLKMLASPAARALSHPAVALGFLGASLYVYFLTPIYRLSEQYSLLGAYVSLHLVVAGCLLWWAIVAKDVTPRPLTYVPRFALVFASVPINVALGVAVSSWGSPLYPAGNTLSDTQTGGDVFWELAVVYTVLVLALLFVSWAFEEERKALGADRDLDAALAERGHEAG